MVFFESPSNFVIQRLDRVTYCLVVHCGLEEGS